MAHVAVLAAAAVLGGWTQVGAGPDGGTVLRGPIAGVSSTIYLPPGYGRTTRYPVLYLLHGVPGSPSEYWGSLDLAARLDSLRQRYIVVTPGGPNRGEWAGAWESFVVHDVVPFVDAHLSTIASAAGRALEGLSAGGYGAVDIGLRHPQLFGTLGSWDGYFAPFRDQPFTHAAPSELRAHDPSLLVEREAPLLRREHVRFYVSVGGNHGGILAAWSKTFVRELTRLRLDHELWQLPKADTGHFWTATVPSALAYAFRSA
jgi:S-formylglutathione hydrolase FrmB